jgi:type IV pilus assembly protein PilA
MLNMLRQRRDEDEGFTLIELMVVVLIIAILIAIAIPTFLGAQDRARDRGAQSDLRNAITAAKTVATDYSGYFLKSSTADLDAATMLATEPSLSFVAIGSASATDVGVLVEDTGTTLGTSITLEKASASGTWFAISADNTGKVTYCKGAAATACNTHAKATLSKW